MAAERKFVEEGLKRARLNEFFASRLDRAGYGGMEINRTPQGTQITIFAEKPGMVIGKQGRTIKKLTTDIKQYQLDNPQIEVKEVEKPELNAQMMANRLASALERCWFFRKAGQSTLQQIIDAGALGCEVILAGKLTGPRKRTQKFIAGYIKHSGNAAEVIVDRGFAIAKRKLGVIGVKVRIIPPGVRLPDFFSLKQESAPTPVVELPRLDRGEEIVEELLGEGKVKVVEPVEPVETPEDKVITDLDEAVEQAARGKGDGEEDASPAQAEANTAKGEEDA